MITRNEATASASKALSLVNERIGKNPDCGVCIHAHQQLERILVELDFPYLPPASKREWVDIGLMAVKELESTDPDFANALMDADYDFKQAG